jgi:hypothetical protein
VRAVALDDAGGETAVDSQSLTISPDPVGHVDLVQSGVSSVWVRGWTLDPDVANTISVHVYQDGPS